MAPAAAAAAAAPAWSPALSCSSLRNRSRWRTTRAYKSWRRAAPHTRLRRPQTAGRALFCDHGRHPDPGLCILWSHPQHVRSACVLASCGLHAQPDGHGVRNAPWHHRGRPYPPTLAASLQRRLKLHQPREKETRKHLLALALRLELVQLGAQPRGRVARLGLHARAQRRALLLVLLAELAEDRELLAVDVLQLLRASTQRSCLLPAKLTFICCAHMPQASQP